jgi:hypothetical protein
MFLKATSVVHFAGIIIVAAGLSACSAAAEEPVEGEEISEELARTSAHFETFIGADGNHYFELVAKSGEIVLRSEGYTTREAARSGIDAVTRYGASKSQFDMRVAKNGEHYFTILASNGEIVAVSETYTTKTSAERAARNVRALVKLLAVPAQQEAAPRRERFETFAGLDKQFYFRLRAGNGEVVLSSEGYSQRTSASRGILSVRAHGRDRGSFEVVAAQDGKYGLRLVARNGEILARGETYASKYNAERAADRIVEMLGDGVSAETNL